MKQLDLFNESSDSNLVRFTELLDVVSGKWDKLNSTTSDDFDVCFEIPRQGDKFRYFLCAHESNHTFILRCKK